MGFHSERNTGVEAVVLKGACGKTETEVKVTSYHGPPTTVNETETLEWRKAFFCCFK